MEERSVERFFVPSSVSDVGMNPNRCFRSMEVNKPEGKPSVKRLGNLTSIWNEFVAYLSKKQIQTRYEEENMSGRESHSAILKQFSGFLAETDFGSHEEASDVLELDSAELGRFGLSSHLLVIFSISRSVFPPRELIQSTVVRAKFETTNPSMVVQKCGMRLVYDQDVGWFTRVTEHDVICLDQVEISTPLGEAHWLCQSLEWEKIIPPLEEETTVLVLRKDLESVLPRYLEFNPSALNCYPMMFKFNLGGSPGWFCEGLFMWSNSAVMPMELPENLHKSKKWMGLAIFASLVEEVGQTMKEDNLVQPSGYDATWFYYTPCTAARKEVWRQCKLARITVWLSTPRLAVQGCALRLLFKEDVEHLVESLTLAGYF